MADLDDFFAKKDKKKSKSKPKFITAEELVKNLEDTSKREALKPKKETVQTIGAENNLVNNLDAINGEETVIDTQEQDINEEWKEFEIEERKDYSGLKIGQLQISDDDQNQQSYGENEEYGDEEVDSDGNSMPEMKRGAGPWKKLIPAEEVTQIEKPPVSKIYISPALRQSNMMVKSKLKSRNAPDITNEDFFPTLGAARPEEQKKKKNEPAFEEVRHGNRMQRVQEQPAAPVSVGNRFKSLADDDS